MAILAKEGIPVSHSCRVLGFSRSGFYDWKKRPAAVVNVDEFALRARAKQLFKESRASLGSRGLMRALNSEGFTVGRYKVRKIIQSHGLKVHQRVAYKVTTQRETSAKAAPNRVKMAFNPNKPNRVWAGDITYLRTAEGWCYLSVVMDLYSRRIIGWSLDKRMTTHLVERSLQQAYWLRKRPKNVIFHSDRGSQYTNES